MNLPLLFNRAGALDNGDWIHIVPKGELPNAEAGVVQVLDDKALDSILANLNADKRRLGNRWPGLYGGREHWIYSADENSEALAWFKEFQKRDDGIWASAEGLTDLGRAAIANKRLKYVSFAVDRKDLEPLGNNRVRVLAIDTVGFTNLPNGRELLTPIANRDGPATTRTAVGSVSADRQQAARKRFAQLAEDEQRQAGVSLASAYMRVMNREPDLAALANGRPAAFTSASMAPEPLEDAAEFAGGEILRRAEELKFPQLSAGIAAIQNRYPRLARLANREGGWDSLSDIEPMAHAAYDKAVHLSPGDILPRYRWEGFMEAISALALRFPDLGFEGRYQKLKEINPQLFWTWVLTFDDRADIPGRPPVYSHADLPAVNGAIKAARTATK